MVDTIIWGYIINMSLNMIHPFASSHRGPESSTHCSLGKHMQRHKHATNSETTYLTMFVLQKLKGSGSEDTKIDGRILACVFLSCKCFVLSRPP